MLLGNSFLRWARRSTGYIQEEHELKRRTSQHHQCRSLNQLGSPCLTPGLDAINRKPNFTLVFTINLRLAVDPFLYRTVRAAVGRKYGDNTSTWQVSGAKDSRFLSIFPRSFIRRENQRTKNTDYLFFSSSSASNYRPENGNFFLFPAGTTIVPPISNDGAGSRQSSKGSVDNRGIYPHLHAYSVCKRGVCAMDTLSRWKRRCPGVWECLADDE